MNAIELVENELAKATACFGPMRSAHEGYAILLEEVEELWDEVRAKKPDQEKIRKEAIQVAAMAVRFLIDVCGTDTRKPEVWF